IYMVPCPHCKISQQLKWKNLNWEKIKGKSGKVISHKPETALYICEHCACMIEMHMKTEMIANGVWLATAKFKGIAGFAINELYSHVVTWPDMVENFLVAKKFPETLKVFINTSLGEVWEPKGDEVDDQALSARREHYAADVPKGVLIITTAVDVQKDRLEVESTGWGLGEENWRLKYTILYGDPSGWDIWLNHLHPLLTQPFKHELGVDLFSLCNVIDSGGHHTQMVYEYCKKYQSARWYPIKGLSTYGNPIISKPTRNNKLNVLMYGIGTDTAKDYIFGRLESIKSPAPGYTHFPMEYGEEDTNLDDYFKRLASEHCITKFVNGKSRRLWVKKSQRLKNEPVDLSVYNLAAFKILNMNLESVAENFKTYARSITPGGSVRKRKGRRILSKGVRR
ncbi:MAG: phage terminase large subunit family protein, partial [Candidatus Peribacteraceae bacterium]|nr:phage terminase large subunit family protein [Candidatus Peribacteraceae bacterium]